MVERTDLEWIQQLKQGDEAAITDLWQWLFKRALTVARRYDQAEDVGRDGVVAAFHRIMQRGIYQYKFQCPFLGFCRTILVNEINRRLKPAPHLLDIDNPATPHPAAELDPPVADAATIRARLQPCMDELQSREQEIITLRYVQDLTPQAIAEQLGLRRNHVNQLAFRARDKLLQCLRSQGFVDSADVLSV